MFHNMHIHHFLPSSDLSAPIAPIPPRVHSLLSDALQRDREVEGEADLHGLQRPIPRHHSFQFHEKARDSIERTMVVTDTEMTSSSSRGSDSSRSTGSISELAKPKELQVDSSMKMAVVRSEVTDIDDALERNHYVRSKQNNYYDGDGDIHPRTSDQPLKISDNVKSQPICLNRRKRPIPVPVESVVVTSSTKVAKVAGPSKKRAVSPDNFKQSLPDEDQSLMKILKRVRKPSSRLAD